MESNSFNNRLIRIIRDGAPQTGKGETSLIEAAFRIPGNTHLQLKVHDWAGKAAEYLGHAVARTPGDLRSHVQRVNLHIHREDAEAVYGALVDLFIVLTDRALPLRERMLKTSRAVLGEERYGFLVQRLEAGLTATDAVSEPRTSLLSKGLSGTNQLVTKLDARGKPLQDPQEEAHDHLEYGQVDEARKVLETAILQEPGRPELHHDLLEIYKSTHDRESFLAMHQRLNADVNPAVDVWRELSTFFGEEG